MTAQPERHGCLATVGLLITLLPWLILPVGAFFLFFGDGPRDGRPDPRDSALPYYMAITAMIALTGVTLAVIGRQHVVRLIVSILFGGIYALIAVAILIRGLMLH